MITVHGLSCAGGAFAVHLAHKFIQLIWQLYLLLVGLEIESSYEMNLGFVSCPLCHLFPEKEAGGMWFFLAQELGFMFYPAPTD